MWLGRAPLCCGPDAITPGSTWRVQALYRDPTQPPARHTTDALRITFLP